MIQHIVLVLECGAVRLPACSSEGGYKVQCAELALAPAPCIG